MVLSVWKNCWKLYNTMETTDQKYIFIIDDDPFITDMYLLRFKEDNFRIEVSRDGKEALQKIHKEIPDLVLLDIVMPVMDGFEVLKEIKSDSLLGSVKVVLLTNLGQKEDVERGMELGADGYIIKAHFTPSQVVAKVREILSMPPLETGN